MRNSFALAKVFGYPEKWVFVMSEAAQLNSKFSSMRRLTGSTRGSGSETGIPRSYETLEPFKSINYIKEGPKNWNWQRLKPAVGIQFRLSVPHFPRQSTAGHAPCLPQSGRKRGRFGGVKDLNSLPFNCSWQRETRDFSDVCPSISGTFPTVFPAVTHINSIVNWMLANLKNGVDCGNLLRRLEWFMGKNWSPGKLI